MFQNQLQLIPQNVPLYDAWQDANPQPANISLVVSGHKHLLQTLDFTDGKVPQFIRVRKSLVAPTIPSSARIR
jgi:hypothetical protein